MTLTISPSDELTGAKVSIGHEEEGRQPRYFATVQRPAPQKSAPMHFPGCVCQ